MQNFYLNHRSAPLRAIVGAVSLCISLPALAIETTPDTITPPKELFRKSSAPNAAQPSVVNSAYIGISTVTVPEMLAVHLGLKKNQGLLIRSVAPDSPAANSKLQINDILLSIGGTELNSSRQLSQLIASKNPDDEVTIKFIHKGKETNCKLTLGERRKNSIARNQFDSLFDAMPEENSIRLRDLIERNLGAFDESAMQDFFGTDDSFEKMKQQMRKQLNQGFQNRGNFSQSSTVHVMDEQGTIEYQTKDGTTTVTVKDLNGKTTWSGPWNTDEEKANAPKALRNRIENQAPQAQGLFQFNFGR